MLPKNRKGLFRIRCDGETFLGAPASRRTYAEAKNIALWEKMPAKSPDLNPRWPHAVSFFVCQERVPKSTHGKKRIWKIDKCSLRIVRVLFAFGATAKHSCELQPPAGPMPRRRTLLSWRRCPLSRQSSTRVGHMAADD